MFTIALLLLVVALFVQWLYARWNLFQTFKRMGVPGPKPSFLWGHFKELRENHIFWEEKWRAEYGPTFGVFWGDKPFLITCDLDIAKQVLIGQFSNFVDRSEQLALESAHPVFRHTIGIEKGERWKRQRMLLSPAFSTGKLKRMTPLIEESINGFEENLRKNASGQQFDVYPLLKRFSMDNISRIVFGIETNVQKDGGQSSKLLKSAMSFLDLMLTGFLDLMCTSFSSMNVFFSGLLYLLLSARIIPHTVNDLVDEIDAVVKARRNAPPRDDLMQSLLDRQQINSDVNSFAASDSAEDQKESSATKTYARLTDEQVSASAIIMFAAGTETTSTAIAFMFICLGLHPQIQERLRREILGATKGKPLCYETAMTLPYLDAVVRESLRLHPPVTNLITRKAAEDTEINGLRIPAGLNILFPPKLIGSEGNLWEEPSVFNPDRFLVKNYNPLAYQAFGDGPRNCIGMRFAHLTIKMLLCKVLPKFEIVATEKPRIKCTSIITQLAQANIAVKEISS